MGLAGFSSIEFDNEGDGFDYYRIDATQEDDNHIISSFAGVSGGGLWQVIVRKSDTGAITWEDPLLQGVAFWQSDVVDGKRYLLCHGPRSVYLRLLERIG